MPRSNLPLTLALVAFLLSLLAGGYAYQTFFRTVPALVAVSDIAPGAEIAPEMVRVVRMPAGGRPPGALYGPGQVFGMYAAAPVFAQQVITARHISDRPPGREYLAEVAPGHRVVSVPIRSETALGGAGRPGDLVDVVAAWPGAEGKPGSVEVLMTGIRLVDLRSAAGVSVADPPEEFSAPGAAVPTTALLLVKPEQARALVAAAESRAAIYLWLAERPGPPAVRDSAMTDPEAAATALPGPSGPEAPVPGRRQER